MSEHGRRRPRSWRRRRKPLVFAAIAFALLLTVTISQISIDYTLLGPHNGTHVVDDVRDAMRFIHDELNTKLAELSKRRIDPKRIAVCGSSAGGYVSYIAVCALRFGWKRCIDAFGRQGIHSPVPLKAIISFYGGGGEFLVDWYLKEKKGE